MLERGLAICQEEIRKKQLQMVDKLDSPEEL